VPIYDYTCSACGRVTEVIHGIHAETPRFCPICGAEGTLRKGITTAAVHFKGSGWAKKDRSASASRRSAASETAGTGSETAGTGSETAASSSTTSSSSSSSSSGKDSTDGSGPAVKPDKKSAPATGRE
jgi:putative FmdB family regulatory protein